MPRSGGVVIHMECEKIRNRIKKLAGGWNFDQMKPQDTYKEEVLEFLEELSKEIRKDQKTASSTQARAFAFWCREKHLRQWKMEEKEDENSLGLGMAFHIAPSNIPLLFAYSMVFGLLSGNGNVIRISQRTMEQSKDLCDVIDRVMQRHQDIYKNNLIMTYERDEEITKEFSKLCDARIIWGGDETILKFKQYPLKPTAMELTFPDRSSIAIFDLTFMKHADWKEKEDLAYRFYNDTLLMDQNACSSPRLVYWYIPKDQWTEKEREEIKEDWWQTFSKISQKYDLTPWKVSKKYEQLCSEIMEFDEIEQVKRYENLIYVSRLKEEPKQISHYQGRFGCFYEYEIKSLRQVCTILDRKIQTIVYEGMDPYEIVKEIKKWKVKGCDRIVRAGSALELERIWDGKNLIKSLSRVITIK